MRFERLQEWLDWQESQFPSPMNLGLERVRAVVECMQWPPRRFPLVVVAGTNGKGSCVAFLQSAFVAAGYKVGTYTSPHLLRYNERIRIDGVPLDDATIMQSFARLDERRSDTTMTYFEFGTLAAMDQFIAQDCDVAVMEIGIGGRLDAVNVFDADIALITTIDIDHRQWLGDDREAIGREKAGILRLDRPAVVAERNPPRSVRRRAGQLYAPLHVLGESFERYDNGHVWTWSHGSTVWETLPQPALKGDFQKDNAAGAFMVLHLLAPSHPVSREAVDRALQYPDLEGRFQQVSAAPRIIVDVAHNAQATRTLADNLRGDTVPRGRTLAVAALLADKDLAAALEPLLGLIDEWHISGLDGPRGDDGTGVRTVLSGFGVTALSCHQNVLAAMESARARAASNDTIVVFGSFHTVSSVLALPCWTTERSGRLR
ncbi:MAG: bifunctional tetrahydrofolate synthase/dihydrofolate synthase [Gammaproteobacteria bacterium]|nr:bifunctional tetrahydrofolate synthase/dihydrofolate synthase [Gammaproteobacteria bacterium]